MVPVNGKEALERVYEALLRRREEKMALSPFKLVECSRRATRAPVGVHTTPLLFTPPTRRQRSRALLT